ncbi:MAG: hypothetical protein KF788_10605 [Piscinibacter sp.]|nr:hypothetical protein [Piscinibacter sp.]
MKSFDLKSALLRAFVSCALMQAALPASADPTDPVVSIISPGLGTLGWWLLLFS